MGSVINPKPVYEETPEQIETRRIQNQSIDEWYQEYDAYFADDPSYDPPKPRLIEEVKQDLFIFDSFRTTRLSRLVLSSVSLESGVIADTFFNVDIKRQRGGGEYETGANGQFFPKENSNFRKFWMQTVRKKPRRWSTVHKEIRTRFKGLIFEGDIKVSYRENSSPYNQLTNLKYTGTRMIQNGNNLGTEREQPFQ